MYDIYKSSAKLYLEILECLQNNISVILRMIIGTMLFDKTTNKNSVAGTLSLHVLVFQRKIAFSFSFTSLSFLDSYVHDFTLCRCYNF